MSQYSTAHQNRQAWEMNARNAVRQGQPIPVPNDGARALNAQERRLWQQSVNQSIAQVQPIQSPAEWLQSQSQRVDSARQAAAAWDKVAANRAAAARPDLPAPPAYGELSESDYRNLVAEVQHYRENHD